MFAHLVVFGSLAGNGPDVHNIWVRSPTFEDVAVQTKVGQGQVPDVKAARLSAGD